MSRVNERIGSALAQHGYEQVRTVGEGSFGKAILVRPAASSQRDSDLKSIVKMIDISRASRKEREEALQESQVLASLKHPNIVKYRHNFLAEGWLCIVMDYCEGGDLTSRIKKTKQQGKSISEAQVLWWFTQGVMALRYIHDLHILHRDLKSGNFFLSKNGNLKMGDFGIAKVLECTAACAQTQVGTPYYLCPEICKGRPYSWGSDIWAMGCILYEMCFGRPPFDGHDLKSLIQKITKAPTPDLPTEYSKDLNDILHKLLNRNAELRPQAEDILRIPIVRNMARKMQAQERSSEASTSEACSDAKRPSSAVSRPSTVSKCSVYTHFAGTYSKHDLVEYYSATHAEWVPATVTSVDHQGHILMDVKPNTWISLEVQADKVRPPSDGKRTPGELVPSPEPKVSKRPSRAPQPCQQRHSACAEEVAIRQKQSGQSPGMQRPSQLAVARPAGKLGAQVRPVPSSARGHARPTSACHEVAIGPKSARNHRPIAVA